MKRFFMKPGARPINDRVHHIEFEFEEDAAGKSSVARRTITTFNTVEEGAKWSFRDAISLVASGNWVEVVPGDDGSWLAPDAAELALIARKRTSNPDAPATTVEMVW